MTRRTWLGAVSGAAFAAAARGQDLPKVEARNVRRAFHNGEHNAFTDLIRFQGRLYLTFRTCPDGHMVHPTSQILVLTSEDGTDWEEVHRFRVDQRDVRDPHFLVFQKKLFVYSGTWYCGDSSPATYDVNDHLGYACWSADGASWDGPRMLEGTYGHYIWRAAAHGAKAYLCGRRKRAFAETTSREERDRLLEAALLESDDGLIWKTAGFFHKQWGNETAFLFEEDGAVIAVARGGGGRNAELVRSQPPYQDWTREDLERFVGGPLLARWGDRYLVGGREITDNGPRTTLFWLADGALHECAELPSDGDNSYPGFVEMSPTRGLLSYYSTHEKDSEGHPFTAIYIADLILTG